MPDILQDHHKTIFVNERTHPKLEIRWLQVRTRNDMATTLLARLSRLWTSSSISFDTNCRLYMSHVVSIKMHYWEILELLRGPVFDSNMDEDTNEYVPNMRATLMGPQEPFLRPINIERRLDLLTSPGTSLCARTSPMSGTREGCTMY
ncbi:hypothetical protein DPMN_130654 [Dreissena polymorpha]|uniref:Uncharacterized protein n=1 Tax=Dreissena polymorpha TaxID=45954 RepID=A0A9D4H5H2_DREPO|nr:hypothetical protein DPMN_130654 [Dreissena polymorpha]